MFTHEISTYNLIWVSGISAYGVTKTEEKIAYTLGDVNNDAQVNSIDYILVKRSCFNTYILDCDEKLRADVDINNKINAIEYLLIKRIAFGTFII